MLYSVLRVIVRFSLKIYFRKIDISGIEHLKPGTAQIIASNHPSGFLEPLIMACFFPRDLYFLVRGDLFENKILKYFLESTHQIPIYRFKDGFSKLRNNADSIHAATDVLLKKKCLLIFVEGGTKSIKKLRPLQKGFVRMASEAVNRNPQLKVEILPLGINFCDSTKLRSEVMIKIQPPVIIDNEGFTGENSQQAAYTNDLIRDVSEKMKESMIHLENQTRLEGMEFGLSMLKSIHHRRQLPTVTPNDLYLKECILWAQKVDQMDETRYEELLHFKKDRFSKYSASFEKEKPGILHYLLLILGAVPALVGYVIHFLPVQSALALAKKLSTSKEFFGSIRFVLGIVFLLVFYISFIILSLVFGWSLWYVAGAIISGVFVDQFIRFLSRYNFMNGGMHSQKEGLIRDFTKAFLLKNKEA